MSGGTMDYVYLRFNDMQDELLKSIDAGGNHPELRMRFASHLCHCSRILRAIEWADSCDTDAGDWVPAAEHLLANAPDEVVTQLTAKPATSVADRDNGADAQRLKKHLDHLKEEMEELEQALRERRESR